MHLLAVKYLKNEGGGVLCMQISSKTENKGKLEGGMDERTRESSSSLNGKWTAEGRWKRMRQGGRKIRETGEAAGSFDAGACPQHDTGKLSKTAVQRRRT